MQPRLRVSKDRSITVTKSVVTDNPTVLHPGIYPTTYGTMANVVNPYIVWDVIYRQSVSVEYVIPMRIRRATYKEFPDYYRDSGQDECIVRGVHFDRSGKKKVRKI